MFASAGLLTGTAYNVGQTIDAGSVVQTSAGGTQTVSFTGLEPVLPGRHGAVGDFGGAEPAGQRVERGQRDQLHARSGGGRVVPEWSAVRRRHDGLVSVDGYETVEFTGFGTLTINAGAGSDTINLRNSIARWPLV